MEDIFNKAADLIRAVPNSQRFTLGMALACCGADLNIAQSQEATAKLQNLLDWRAQQWGAPLFSNDDEAIIARAKIIATNSVRLPDWKVVISQDTNRAASRLSHDLNTIMSKSGMPIKKADVLRLAGAREEQIPSGKFPMRIGRFMNALKKEDPNIVKSHLQAPVQSLVYDNQRPFQQGKGEVKAPLCNLVQPCSTISLPSISPMSSQRSSSIWLTDSPSTATNGSQRLSSTSILSSPSSAIDSFQGMSSKSTSSLATDLFETESSKRDCAVPLSIPKPLTSASSTNSSLSSLTTKYSKNRKGSKSAFHDIQEKQLKQNIQSAAFKCATIIQSEVQADNLPLEALSSADKIAEGVNNLFQVQAISGRQILDGIKKGLTGKTPPRQGRQSRIPEEDIKLLSNLLFSSVSIEQANVDPHRTTRPELTSIFGSIVNNKMESEDKEPVDDVKLFKRIQQTTSLKLDLHDVNGHEALRTAWFSYNNLLRHYENWERDLVELGFARVASSEELEATGEYVIFKKGQKKRVCNFDEWGLSLSGSKNGQGGRPAMSFSNSDVNEIGKSENKSGYKISGMSGVNFEGEAFPIAFVLPSKAENPRVNVEFIKNLHQVKGEFGWEKVMHFDCSIAFSENGSFTNKIFYDWILNVLGRLYPDAADVQGKRVLLKGDMGPGRASQTFLADARTLGFYFKPGLPNTTQATQEMDQLYALFKSIIESNRKLIYEQRAQEKSSETAQIEVGDIPYMVFGGHLKMKDTMDGIHLKSAFNIGFARDTVLRGLTKCGYCPATRSALKSHLVRHEAFVTPDGEADVDADPGSYLLFNLVRQNHDVVAKLISKGYKTAAVLKRDLKMKKASPPAGLQTDELQQLTCPVEYKIPKSAGEFFRLTNGGGLLNCDEVLIAHNNKNHEIEIGQLEKKKKKYHNKQAQVRQQVRRILTERKPLNKWSKPELANMLTWKDPGVTNLGAMGKQKLMEIWKTNYDQLQVEPVRVWTFENEQRLLDLKSNKETTTTTSNINDTDIMQMSLQREAEFLAKRLQAIGPQRAKKVIFEYVKDNNQDDPIFIAIASAMKNSSEDTQHETWSKLSSNSPTEDEELLQLEREYDEMFHTKTDAADINSGVVTNINSAVLEQGSAAVEQGSAVMEQGSAVVEQGSTAVEQGFATVEKGSAVVVEQGSAVVEQGSTVVEQGSVVVELGSAAVEQGSAVVVEQGPAAVELGSAIVEQGSTVVNQELAIVEQETTIVEDEIVIVEDKTAIVEQETAIVEQPSASSTSVLFQFPFDLSVSDVDNLCAGKMEELQNNKGVKTSKRRQCSAVTLTDNELERLSTPHTFLNDENIAFYQHWLTCGQDSPNTLYLGSHFFNQLLEGGPDSVQQWTASSRKAVDIFSKKFIIIVVNMHQHWSLVTIVNPGELFKNESRKFNEEAEMPFILHMDSLGFHDGDQVSRLLYSWLNSEALRLEKGSKSSQMPFAPKTMPLCNPHVPQQNNSYDCGVFVCRFLFSVHHLQRERFTSQMSTFQNKRGRIRLLKKWITDNPLFQFDIETITQLRSQMATLVLSLSQIYSCQKKRATKTDTHNPLPFSRDQLEAKKVPELKSICKQMGILVGKKRKDGLIDALLKTV